MISLDGSFVLILAPQSLKAKHPPLAVMKFITYCKQRGVPFELHTEEKAALQPPDVIFLSTLFTYDAAKYNSVIQYYQNLYPQATWLVGGVFASLMPQYFAAKHDITVHRGLDSDLDACVPDFAELSRHGVETDSILLYASRGCPNKCSFCCVPKVEGPFAGKASIKAEVQEIAAQKPFLGITLFDNNFTAHGSFFDVVQELFELGFPVDFSQGLDAILITEEQVAALAKLSFKSQSEKGTDYIRFAFDRWAQEAGIERSLKWCKEHNVKASYFAYFLYNFKESPKELYARMQAAQAIVNRVEKTVFLFPQEYAPLDSLTRHRYVSPEWSEVELTGFRKLYTYIHGFIPITRSGNVFNWIGRTEADFLTLLQKHGTMHAPVVKRTELDVEAEVEAEEGAHKWIHKKFKAVPQLPQFMRPGKKNETL